MMMLEMILVTLLMVGSLVYCHNEDVCKTCSCYWIEEQYTVDCTNKHLSEIPSPLPNDTSRLILKDNRIAEIPNHIFNNSRLNFLDISNNSLQNLSMSSFSGLESLIILKLQNNTINYKGSNYPVGVFKPLINLKHLDISSNIGDFYTSLVYPATALSDLVSLQELKIDGIPNLYLGSGFSKLKNLIHLNFSGTCVTSNIKNGAFVSVPEIEELILSNCLLRNIGNNSFSVFTKLRLLDLSFNNYLGFDEATQALFKLNSPDFRILDLSAIVPTFAVGIVITGLHMHRLKHLNITDIYLDHNRFELIEMEAISQIPTNIRFFSIRDNRPTYGAYLIGLENMVNLVCMDSSQQYRSHDPTRRSSHSYRISSELSRSQYHYSKYCPLKRSHSTEETWLPQQTTVQPMVRDLPLSSISTYMKVKDLSLAEKFNRVLKLGLNIIIPVPPNIKYANCSTCVLNYRLPKMKFGKNGIKVIDLSVNILNKWIGPILGLEELEYLDLSNNFCDYVSNSFFQYLPSLRELHIASNFLSVVLSRDASGEIFRSLTKLEVMDISENKLQSLPPALLQHLTNLKKLRLSANILNTWNLKIDHMKNLEYIDLSSNQLTTLPVEFRNFADSQFAKKKIITVDLSGQTLMCTCENLDFLEWMYTNKTIFVNRNGYKCKYRDNKVLNLSHLDEIIIQLKKDCASLILMTIILITSLSVVVSLVIGSVVYRYRWKLRYLYYLTRSRYRRLFPINDEENESFEFDAFVSYADEDRFLVTQDMRQKLEVDDDLKLCIHHRDFIPGEEIAANILNAVRNSKKTLILLTRNFLNSFWCIYELNMAKIESVSTGRNVLIVIVCEHIPVRELPDVLVELMKEDCYIDYTDDHEGNIVFWSNLKRAINAD